MWYLTFQGPAAAKSEAPLQPPQQDVIDIVDMIISKDHSKNEAVKLVSLLHRYARENLLLANIYIKDPAVTLIKRDQVQGSYSVL